MTAAAWAAIFGGISAFASVFLSIFVMGKLVERISDHGVRLDKHDGLHAETSVRLTELEKAAERSAGFREGLQVSKG